ncbi:MAG: hypothetical protein EAZ55_13655 [Cytophagales bacterium]|nr:MAG: hypothetical protein EAZ55_13655 [Cytophagales bacterium]
MEWDRYGFVANNPIIFKDPNGTYIIIYYEEDGKQQGYRYEYGVSYEGDNSFIQNTVAQLDYLIENSPIDENIIQQLATDEDFKWEIVNITLERMHTDDAKLSDGITTLGIPTTNVARTSYFDLVGFKTNTGGLQSPVSTLYHEGGHAYLRLQYYQLAQKYQETKDPNILIELERTIEKMESTTSTDYLNDEEQYVNETYEIPLAKQMGDGIRTSDFGSKTYETTNPFTSKPKGFIGPINLPPGKLPKSVIKTFR